MKKQGFPVVFLYFAESPWPMAFGTWPSAFGSQHISFQNYSRSPKEGRRASRSEHNPARPTGARRVDGFPEIPVPDQTSGLSGWERDARQPGPAHPQLIRKYYLFVSFKFGIDF